MSGRQQTTEALVKERFRAAMLFSIPLFLGLVLLLFEAASGHALLPQGVVLVCLVAGLLIAAVPVTRYHRARLALERERTLANLAALADAFEPKR